MTTYSPDGQTLLASEFVKKSDGTTIGTLFTIRDDGTERTVLATNANGFDWPRFGSDGKHIVYVTEGPTHGIVCVLDVATHETTTVLDDLGLFPELTPDGSGIVFVKYQNEVASIRLVDLATHDVRTLIDHTGSGYGIDTGFEVAPD